MNLGVFSFLVRMVRLELTTYAMSRHHSNQLSYIRMKILPTV